MTLSLRNRIWAWSAGSMLAVLFAFFLIADNSFRSTIERELETSARAVAQLAVDQHTGELRDFIGSSTVIARDPQLVATVSTDDSITVVTYLEGVLPTIFVDWLAVVRLDGRLLAATPGANLAPLSSATVLLHDARSYDTGDVWADAEGLVHVAAGPVLLGDQPLAILIAGRRLDSSIVVSLEDLLQQRVALLAANQVIASDDSTAAALRAAGPFGRSAAPVVGDPGSGSGRAGGASTDGGAGSARERIALPGVEPDDGDTVGPSGDGARHFFLSGEEFLGLAQPILNADGEPVASVLAYRSLDAALEPARQLRLTLLEVAGAGVAVAFILGLALARTVTAPVNRLIQDAERLGSGDLDNPIVPSRPDEIGELATGFDRMRVSLKTAQHELVRSERLSAIGQMASSIVHDFSNPLVGIRLNADVLEMDGLSPEDLRCVHGIKAAVDRLNEMMRELLDFAGGSVSIDRKPTDLAVWLEDLERFWTANLGSMRVEFRLKDEYRGVWTFDPARLRRVIDNLIKNAQSAVRPGGAITLRTSLQGDSLRIEVADTGTGIPPELHETLFQPFVTHGKKEGTGLGLAICQNLVERHGGTIGFTSSSQGTTFTILIPQAPVEELQEATA